MTARRTPTFVGRSEELAVLRRHAEAATGGQGGVVIVYGEAGVGKTRLLSELRDEAATLGMMSAAGRATEDGGAYRVLADVLLAMQRSGRLPAPAVLEPFAGMIATLVPGWAPSSGDTAPADRSLVLSEALIRLLGAVGDAAPVLLLLDDLQWVDADTRPVLDRLADVVDEVPALLVLAVRDEVPDPLAGLSRRASDVLRLPRLSSSETRALVEVCGQGRTVPPRSVIVSPSVRKACRCSWRSLSVL